MSDSTSTAELLTEVPVALVPKEVEIVDVAADGAKALPFTKSFTVTWKNLENGVVKVGTFTATRPGLGKLGKIAVLKAKLNGGEQVDPGTDFMHAIMADLHFILTDVPDWWRPDEFFTVSPLREVWDHVGAWLDNFHKRRVG